MIGYMAKDTNFERISGIMLDEFHRVHERFDAIDGEFGTIDKRFSSLASEISSIHRRLDTLDEALGNVSGFFRRSTICSDASPRSKSIWG